MAASAAPAGRGGEQGADWASGGSVMDRIESWAADGGRDPCSVDYDAPRAARPGTTQDALRLPSPGGSVGSASYERIVRVLAPNAGWERKLELGDAIGRDRLVEDRLVEQVG